MATSARVRLYQYSYSPYCIPIALALHHSGIPYEVVDLPTGDPRRVIELTKGECYQVPVLEEVLSRRVIFDRGNDEVARFVAELAPLMKLFPEEAAGWQKILLNYIENECEAVGFKICDAFRDKWLKNDVERGLHRRHKERKFGVGCLEEWTRNVASLTDQFYRLLVPFEQILGRQSFLTGEQPVYADYALCGVIGNFLYPGETSLPGNFLMLEAWFTKMRTGNFRNPLEQIAVGEGGEAGTAGPSDVSDIEKALRELKIRPGTQVLDVGTGRGEMALALAAKGLGVTACDMSKERLQAVAKAAGARKLTVTLQEHPGDELPYADGVFGLVTSRLSGHRLARPESFIREAARVLKTYGHLVLIDGTVPDDQVEAYEWLNEVERLRDAEHVRFVTPNLWRRWCVEAGLTVSRLEVESVRHADLNVWLGEAGASAENRKQIMELLTKAPASVRELFRVGQEEGRIVLSWRRLMLVAGKV